MRVLLRGIGIVAATVLLATSAGINARFGYGLGQDAIDGIIYAGASVAADAFKAASVFFMACASLMMFVLCTGYSLTSAVGFAAVSRAEMTETRAIPQRRYASIKRHLADARATKASLGRARTHSEVAAAIKAQERHYRWQATKGCTDVTARLSRAYCARHDQLLGELVLAEQHRKATERIAELEAELQALERGKLAGTPDPQAALLASLLRTDLANMQMGLALLLAGLVEVGSGLGLFVATQSGRNLDTPDDELAEEDLDSAGKDGRSKVGQIDDFAISAVRRCDGTSCELGNVVTAYRHWCRENGLGTLPPVEVEERLVELFADAGVPTAKRDGTTLLIGIALDRPG